MTPHQSRHLILWLLLIALAMLIGVTWLGLNVRWYGAREELYRGLFETFQYLFE